MAPEMLMAGPESGSGAWSALLLREQDGGSLVTDRRWDTLGMGRLGWLSEYSESSLRSALRVAGAGLDRLPIELTGTNDLSHPTWASGSATVDGHFLAKFAFSEPTAVRVWHEARVLKLLAEQPAFDVPDVVAASPDPACLVTRIVESEVPLSYELVRASLPARVDALGSELARFLASLHARQILARDRLGDPLRIPEPGLQATTGVRLQWSDLRRPDLLANRGTYGGARSSFRSKRSFWTPLRARQRSQRSKDRPDFPCAPRRSLDHHGPERCNFAGPF